MILAALTLEEKWDFALLGVSVAALVIGAIGARALATRENAVFRIVGPAFLLLIMAAFGVFVFFARYYVR